MPETSLFDGSIQKIKLPFRLIGINIDHKKRNLKQNCILVFNYLWVLPDFIATLAWLVRRIINGEDFMELTYVVPCVTNGFVADAKAIFLILQESKVHTLMDNLRALETKSKDFVNSEKESIIKPEITFLNIVIKVLNVINSLMLVVFIMIPLIKTAVNYFTTGQVELLLPFLDVYPFDSTEFKYWPFAFIHQCWTVVMTLLKICGIDYFFFTCCTHIRIQFKLLRHQFQEIIANRSVSGFDPVDQMAIRTKCQELVKWHQGIISSADMLEGIYSKSTLFNFMASSMIICLSGFNVTTVDDTVLVVTFMVFLFMSLLQVFFLCLFGDILMNSSMEVADAVYNSRWYFSDMVIRRNILLVQTR
ncbi:hypothetical protein ABMA27_009955 [Loxostege sticticalis]